MKKYITFFFLLNLISLLAPAQQYNFRNYSIDKGLVKSTVFSMIQDTKGYMWFGTDGGGLSKFDGKSFVTYDTKNGLVDNTVRCLLEDTKGNIWVGTHKGISVFDGVRFFNIDQSKGLPEEAPVFVIYEDSKNNIWAGSMGGGLYKIEMVSKDSANIRIFTMKADDLTTNFIFDILENEGQLYLALYGGINILTFKGDTSISDIVQLDADYNQIPSNIIYTMEKDKNGDLWCGTRDVGVFKIIMKGMDKGEITRYSEKDGFMDLTVWDILSDKQGRMWFATDKRGLVRQTSSGFKNYMEKNGFAGNQVMCLLEDSEQSIWAGTYGSGVSQFLGEDFIHLTEKDNLTKDKIFDIKQDRYGNYWLATDGNGLVRMTFKNNVPYYEYFTTDQGLISNYTYSLSIDKEGKIWVATQEGVSRFNGKKFKNYTREDHKILENSVISILADLRGSVWFGTKSGMLRLRNDGFIPHQEKEEGYTLFNDIQTIIEDKDSNLWYGTSGGLLKNDGKHFTYFDEEEGLNHKEIRSIIDDKFGNIWIGTFGGGLYKYQPTSTSELPFSQVASDEQLSSNNIYSMIFLDDSTLIIGTDRGFDKIIFDGLQNIKDVVNYDQTNGFIGVENNQNAIFKDRNGHIWFGTVKGLTKFNSIEEKRSFPPPVTHITAIDLFYKKVNWMDKVGSLIPFFNLPKDLSLKYKENNLTFRYSGIYLNNPEKVTFQYILEGIDQDWSPIRKDGYITYPGLTHGDYTFKVVAYNDRGKRTSEPTKYSFTINPPFWKTTWFIILCIVVLIAVIVFYVKYRERKLKRDKKILEQKVRERTAQIRKQKEEIAEQKEHIEHIHKEVTDSIQYAEKIQTAILPSNELANEILNDHFILFRPRDIVSGDFYWLTKIKNYNIFTAADCTGHGVPGAFMSMLGVSFLNDIVNKRGITSSSKILVELRKYIISSFQQMGDHAERKEGMDIALSILDTNTNMLQFSGAYNPLYLIRKKDERNEMLILSDNKESRLEPVMENEEYNLFEIKGDKMPAAIYVKMHDFTNHTFPVIKGDTLYMFSDGFPDQFGGEKARKYMAKPFKRYLLSIQNQSMTEQKDSLNNEIINWMSHVNPSTGEEFTQIDDVVIMGVRI